MGMLTISPSPHEHSSETVSKLMYGVIIALLPAFIASVYFFGIGTVIITVTAMVSCVIFEFLIQRFLMKEKPAISDGSAMVTGMLLAFCLPTNLPVWLVILGSFVAISVGKMSFGGLGNNPFNPALVGRVFLFVSFPVQLTSWPVAGENHFAYLDASTGATPLSIMKEGMKNGERMTEILLDIPFYLDMFIGRMGGSAGEIAAAALLIGFIYLLIRKIITWHIPVSILLTVTVFTGIMWLSDPTLNPNPLFHLLGGGLMLGAIFMATDYVTSPMNVKGMWIYGIGIGIITVVIRVFGAYPEGVQFAILIMNAFTPLINKYVKPRRFGEEVTDG
ncbi:MAG: Na+-transporting NADH:ubiquinone oxidoreductase subunit D [Bacteroides sp. SM1_62]|nr:MAG: Na+-transporting NADH:ubiquinone oxidoreductase subunit D [Bacteroides sp. SM23_62]KPL22223.1 MAG: Na+-transporting NADH:ubiquinone oxidoreductase subunit D [Bacteroides sp. SM1_62]